MKKIGMLITGVAFVVCGYSQTTQQSAEKQIQDPQRKANAGKADAIIANKKNIFDSTTFNNNTDITNSKTVKASIKKKHCDNKTKQSSKTSGLKKKT